MSQTYPRKSKPRGLPVKSLALLGLVAVAYWGWQQTQAKPSALDGYQFSTVRYADIEDLVTATGSLQPRDYVDVGTQVSGQLTKILVSVGSQVQKGELLAEIDPIIYRAQVDASRAQLRNLRAQKQEREAQLALAKLQYQRQQNLKKAEATTTESLQQAKLALDSSLAQIESNQAQIEQTESSLRADAAKLDYAKIYAPMSGTVVSITARQGQTLNSNQQAPIILRIADLSTMTVKTQVSEADVSKLQLGMPAYFTTLGSKSQRWHGKLQQIEPTPEVVNNVVLYNALFDVPNSDGKLMTQMTAQVFFVVASRHQVLSLPVSVLNHSGAKNSDSMTGTKTGPAANRRSETARTQTPDPSQATDGTAQPERRRRAPHNTTATAASHSVELKVKTADGALELRRVELGLSNRVQTEVLSGLHEGDEVVSGIKTLGKANNSGNMPPGLGPNMMRSR